LSDQPTNDLCIALTTARTVDEARRIAELLVERRLASCVNILPGARSVYRWKGVIEEAAEAMLTIKTSRARRALRDPQLRPARVPYPPHYRRWS